MTVQTKCPICSEPAARSATNPNRPFCSKRCKLVDLSKWFGGEYSIPGPPVDSRALDRLAVLEDDDGSPYSA